MNKIEYLNLKEGLNNLVLNDSDLFITSASSSLVIDCKESVKRTLFLDCKENLSLSFNISSNVSLDLSIVIFSTNSTIDIDYYLNGVGSKLKVYEVSSVKAKCTLKGHSLVHHVCSHTESNSSIIYLVDHGCVDRYVSSIIKNKTIGTIANETVKGILLSDDSTIISHPELIVSTDETVANHGCAIGSIDKQTIYYLMSRGLSREESYALILKSYLDKFISLSSDESLRSRISKFIEVENV